MEENEFDIEGTDVRMQDVIVIEVQRTDYSTQQVRDNRRTMTWGEFKARMEDMGAEDDTLIMTSHDNGYTYGPIRAGDFRTDEVEVPQRG